MKKISRLAEITKLFIEQPMEVARAIWNIPEKELGGSFGRHKLGSKQSVESWFGKDPLPNQIISNPLRSFMEKRKVGRGVTKWSHYLDAYNMHLSKFVGREDVRVIEIGIFSGGSLEMWREYFGPQAEIVGVDIEKACLAYEGDRTRVFIGDQGDPEFWRVFLKSVPAFDVVIDDGGHLPEQQITTLQCLLPCVRPGGVYICEDVHGIYQRFQAFMDGLGAQLNAYQLKADGSYKVEASQVQKRIRSITHYLFMTVLEMQDQRVDEFECSRSGSIWQPFQC